MLERAPREEAGGNTRFTAGAMRFAYDGVEDLRRLMPDLTDEEVAVADFGAYPQSQFFLRGHGPDHRKPAAPIRISASGW